MAQNFQHDLETGLIQSLKDDFETKIQLMIADIPLPVCPTGVKTLSSRGHFQSFLIEYE